MLKDDSNFSYNDGGYTKPLKTWSAFSPIQYIQFFFCKTFEYTQKENSNPFLRQEYIQVYPKYREIYWEINMEFCIIGKINNSISIQLCTN